MKFTIYYTVKESKLAGRNLLLREVQSLNLIIKSLSQGVDERDNAIKCLTETSSLIMEVLEFLYQCVEEHCDTCDYADWKEGTIPCDVETCKIRKIHIRMTNYRDKNGK